MKKLKINWKMKKRKNNYSNKICQILNNSFKNKQMLIRIKIK